MLRLAKKYWTVLRVGLVVFRIRLLLRVWSLPRVLVALSPARVTDERDDSVMDDVSYYVDRWLQVVPSKRKGNCFPRSLTLYYFAWRSGYPVQFHCGVRMGYLNLEGYAWLTLNGEPFYELTQQWKNFTVTYSCPPEVTQGEARLDTTSSDSSQVV
jgi:hypothetical protein